MLWVHGKILCLPFTRQSIVASNLLPDQSNVTAHSSGSSTLLKGDRLGRARLISQAVAACRCCPSRASIRHAPTARADVREQKITLGEMRASGPIRILVYCQDYCCAHSVTVDASQRPDDVRLSDLEPKFTCRACGHRGADVRPMFDGYGPGRDSRSPLTKPFSRILKSSRNEPMLRSPQSIRGCDHVAAYSECDLPPFPQGRPSRHCKRGSKAMTEILAPLLAFLSISVFVAHAFDAYRTG